jgi:hypothetical protein
MCARGVHLNVARKEAVVRDAFDQQCSSPEYLHQTPSFTFLVEGGKDCLRHPPTHNGYRRSRE